jgi:hypothetical protein
MIFHPKMPEEFRCPNCQSDEFIDYGELIECSQCGFEFFKEILDSDMEEENILSDQELEGLTEAFQDEFKDKKDRERFFKSIEDDLNDLQE